MLTVPGMNQTLSQNLVDLGKQLLEACKSGEVEEVKSLMNSGAPFTTDWLGASPLHFAAANGHANVIEVLLRAGVSRDTRTKVDRTPLHVAAQEGHLDIVNLLISNGADVDAKDLLRMTPLHWAVERGYFDCVEALLSQGADADLTNKFDKTPIDIALDSAQTEMVNLLQKYSNHSNNRNRSATGQNEMNRGINLKSRPIVLPNKATRTTKSLKAGTSLGSNIQKVIVNQKGSISLDALNRILNNNESSNLLAGLTSNLNKNNQQFIIDDPVDWLESQGVDMKKGDNDSLVSSVIDSGQTINLTEAGKLALNALRNQTPTSNPMNVAGKKKVITIVTPNSARLPQVVQQNSSNSVSNKPIVVVTGGAGKNQSPSSPVKKTIKISSLPKNLTLTRNSSGNMVISPNKSSVVIDGDSEEEEEEEGEEDTPGDDSVPVASNANNTSITEVAVMSLRKELINCRKLLQEAKSTIQDKDKEIDRLRNLLKEKGIKY